MIQYQNMVDIFYAVKTLRNCKPNMVESLVSASVCRTEPPAEFRGQSAAVFLLRTSIASATTSSWSTWTALTADSNQTFATATAASVLESLEVSTCRLGFEATAEDGWKGK